MDIEQLIKSNDFGGITIAMTGGTGVLGSEMACALVRSGANVAILARNPSRAGTLKKRLEEGSGSDTEALVQILESAPEPRTRVRMFSGYAGWGAGQLEAEMREHSWIVRPGTARHLVFDVEPESMWAEALRELGPRYAHLTTIPLDPRVN